MVRCWKKFALGSKNYNVDLIRRFGSDWNPHQWYVKLINSICKIKNVKTRTKGILKLISLMRSCIERRVVYRDSLKKHKLYTSV